MILHILSKTTLSLHITLDPFKNQTGNFLPGIQDKGMANSIFTEFYISIWEISLHVMVVLHGAPVVTGSIIKQQLPTQMFITQMLMLTNATVAVSNSSN